MRCSLVTVSQVAMFILTVTGFVMFILTVTGLFMSMLSSMFVQSCMTVFYHYSS